MSYNDILECKLFLMSVNGSCCKAVIMWRSHEAESTTCSLVLFYTIILMCYLCKSYKLKSTTYYTAATGFEKHFTHHIWPWQIAIHPVRRVSVFMTFHDTAIPMINPSIRRVFSQPGAFWYFGEELWFICCDALFLATSTFSGYTQLWQSLISRRPNRGCNSLQTQTHIIFLSVAEMKLGQTCVKCLCS